MSGYRLLLLALSAAVTAAAPCLAQDVSAQSVAGTGTIFQPIALAKVSDLEFGTVVRPASGQGVVTVDPATGARSLTGQGALLGSGAAAGRAAFQVGGEGGQAFGVSAPPTLAIVRAGGSETINVTLSPTLTSGVLSGSLGSAGSASFGVGGTITLDPSIVSGAYAGSVQVVVTYN